MKPLIPLFIWTVCMLEQASAQATLQVYPGDVTNNGEVNNLDFLHLGLAYNYAGPPRDTSALDFSPKTALPWAFQFPGGLNMAYADCNGDGFVNYFFDAFPLYTHYGQRRDSMVTEDVFLEGLAGVDPSLAFDTTNIPNVVFSGQQFSLPIQLGSSAIPVEDLYGIAFSVTLPPAVFDVNQTQFNFSEISWANPDNDRIWMMKKAASNRVDIGWVRTDRNQKRGYGNIGYADFVIIVDVVGLQQPYPIVIERVKMMDKFGNYATVAGDTIWVNVAPEALLADETPENTPAVDVYPNPAGEQLFISASTEMQHLALYDMLGRKVLEQPTRRERRTELALPRLASGMYLLRIDTDRGVVFRRIQIQQ
ncbi:MAG: T9SS type A sorting domain-containing protein [Saprospiraceae bacterium]|nr:T9SS type A sorting domain-containing protein [Saprospiraceae bacterium]